MHISKLRNMLFILFHEKPIVFGFFENILKPVTMIENMAGCNADKLQYINTHQQIQFVRYDLFGLLLYLLTIFHFEKNYMLSQPSAFSF